MALKKKTKKQLSSLLLGMNGALNGVPKLTKKEKTALEAKIKARKLKSKRAKQKK